MNTTKKTFSTKFCLWFIGTCLNTVVHPHFGKHKLTKEQFKYSSGDYKSSLFKCITRAIKRGDITDKLIREKS